MATKRARTSGSVLVVGSINVDLYQHMPKSEVTLGGVPVSCEPIRGMTLPAASVVQKLAGNLDAAGLSCSAGGEEAFVLGIDGPFEQKTGGTGANAAAAAAQTYTCELIGNFGATSAEANEGLLADLATYGGVRTSRCATLPGVPTGTAYICSFADRDNAILLLRGANHEWADQKPGMDAMRNAVALMLQREVPDEVNLHTAKMAAACDTPVFMDVGGSDAPLDPDLASYLTCVAPNESELTFITGVETRRDGSPKRSLVRQAVAKLKGELAMRGNPKAEVLVTLGGQGCMHFGSEWSPVGVAGEGGLLPHESRMGFFALGTPDSSPVDTTGAGDCFRGSYVAARYGEAKSVTEALRWAAAAGSLAVEVEGAMPSMPSRAQIEVRASNPVLYGDGDFDD